MSTVVVTDSPMTNLLSGSVAVVSGASGGIGRAVAVGLAEHGAKVCAIGRNAASLEETLAATPSDSTVHSYQADLTSDEEIGRLADWLRNEFGRVDILVHCAGVICHRGDHDR